MKPLKPLLTVSSAALLALAVACGGGATPVSNDASESPKPSTTTPTATMVSTHVYFLRGEKVASVHRSVPVVSGAVATATMRALLAGPTGTERAAGLVTAIPTGTQLLGVTISNGTADVDLSAAYQSGGGTLSMTARLMQVVYTLTQFPTVHQVTFRLEGEPLTVLDGEGIIIDQPQTRADYESFLPPIFIDSPAIGETVTSPVTVRGVANVYEGQFLLEVTDANGKVLVQAPAHASMGTFTEFSNTLSFTVTSPGPGRVTGFDYSAKDGSRVQDYVVPVTLK